MTPFITKNRGIIPECVDGGRIRMTKIKVPHVEGDCKAGVRGC